MKKSRKIVNRLSFQKMVIADLVPNKQMDNVIGGASRTCGSGDSAVPISAVVACTTEKTITRTNTSTVI